MARKYALDSNVFIDSFRDREKHDALRQFRAAMLPFEYLSAVVVQELRSGARSKQAARLLQSDVFEPFERRGRVFAPSYDAWKRTGEALAGLAVLEGIRLREFARTFVNDVLLAASCREHGIVLVTGNKRDCARIARVMTFDFVTQRP